jgi:hypothetical protein
MSSDIFVPHEESVPNAQEHWNSQPARSSLDGSTDPARIWLARGFIVAFASFLAWFTWGHWGDFQIDNGREIYVPVAILQGKLLFRDIWYMYGPLAPYVQALLFRIFGIHLTVLYLFGLALTIGSAISTFEIAGQFDLDLVPRLVAPLFFLSEAFYPFIFNFVFPYSYAASLAAFLGLACVYFVIRHARQGRPTDLAAAALIASFALLAKLEFGVACLGSLGFDLLVRCWIDRSLRTLKTNLPVCLAGLSPALAGYGWFTWKLSVKTIFFDNWVSTPGTYFMRTFGKRMIPAQGFRFIPSEILHSVEMTALVLAMWAAVAAANVYAIKKWKSQTRISVMVFLLDILLAVATIFGLRDWANMLHPYLIEAILPHGLYFLGVFFVLQAIWKLWRSPGFGLGLPEAVLGLYATLVSARVMMRLSPSAYSYSVFFNVSLFLVFVILLARIGGFAGRDLKLKTRSAFVASLLGAEALLLVPLLLPIPKVLPTPLTTEFGTFYTRPDVANLFPQIISFMKEHTRNGRDILVLPEPPSLYVFAGMQAPTQWYSVLPGVVDPDHEQVFVNQATSNDVRYVLISNRSLPEYGLTTFGLGYNQVIFRWITENFRKVGQFGPLPDSPPNAYVMNIFERKDLQSAR